MTDRHETDHGVVELSDDVTERIESRLPRTEFDTVDDYATTALDMLLRQVARTERNGEKSVSGADERADTADIDNPEAVEDQLESLGYL